MNKHNVVMMTDDEYYMYLKCVKNIQPIEINASKEQLKAFKESLEKVKVENSRTDNDTKEINKISNASNMDINSTVINLNQFMERREVLLLMMNDGIIGINEYSEHMKKNYELLCSFIVEIK